MIEEFKKEIKDTFPDTPESSPDKDDPNNYDHYEDSSSDDGAKKKKIEPKNKNMFSKMRSFMGLSKKEQKDRQIMSTKSKKLPKNFAN